MLFPQTCINCSQLTVVAGEEEGLPVLTDFSSSLFPMRQAPKEKAPNQICPNKLFNCIQRSYVVRKQNVAKTKNILNQCLYNSNPTT